MKKHPVYFYLLLLFLSAFNHYSCRTKPAPCKNDSVILQDMQHSLKSDLLDIWYPRIIDETHGGYHSVLNYKWDIVSSFPKIIVSQARGLWTVSKAALRFPDNSTYSLAADHGFQYLKQKAWDTIRGGFYEHIPHAEDPAEPAGYKTAYGNAFAIYALSAYYDLTQNPEALILAMQTFHWLEEHFHDPVYGGYFQFSDLSGISYLQKDVFDPLVVSAHLRPYATYKDYNSSIHIMEAFTALYELWPDPHLKKRLHEMIIIIRDNMITEKGYLEMMFTEDWQHISFRDSTRQFLMQNSWYDHISFGHDTETAFLLLEAASHFDSTEFNYTLDIAKKVIDFTLKHGFDKNQSGIFYEGYYLKGDTSLTIINPQKQWWVQGEAMNAYLMFSLLYPENPAYKEAFYSLWHFIDSYVIDHEHGGWFSEAISSNPARNKHRLKAQPWKSNYHSYRAVSQCIDMLETQTIPFLANEASFIDPVHLNKGESP